MLAFLEHYRWIGNDKGVLEREIEFLKSSQMTMVDRWLFLCIDGPKKAEVYQVAGQQFRPFNRKRVGTSERFNAYSESDHRPLVEYLAGVSNENIKDLQAANPQTEALKSPRQAIFVFYPTRDKKNPSARVTPGFALQFPKNHIKTPIRFGVHVKNRPDAVVVDE